MIQLAITKASYHTMPVPSEVLIFVGVRDTQIGADMVTTPVITFPNSTTLLSPSVTMEAGKGGIQV